MEPLTEQLRRGPVALPPPSIHTPEMSTDITKRLGLQLREARETAGLTQTQAAELAGVKKSRWSQMESGGVANINTLLKACLAIGAVLDVDVRVPSEE
jgi:DNA-binding XRE family transcriptional regulator